VLEDKKEKLESAFRAVDDDDMGEIPLNKIHQIFKELGIYNMDEDIKAFFEYMAFRQSESLEAITIMHFRNFD